MDKQAIIEQLGKLNTVGDFANLLNIIKQDEFGSIRYCISEKMLKHFSSDTIVPKRFRSFKIRKKSGGFREIKAPCRQLGVILTCVNILLKSIYEPSDVAMGFTSGRSVLNNAQVHVGHNYVFNIDLKDFFPSIPQARLWKRLQLPPFNFSKDIASVLAGLCCTYDEEAKGNVLSQGSPASPLLTNAICDKLDRRMKGVAKRFGLHYSRYADDMTFSSMHNVYQEGGAFRTEIQRIIAGQGFRMNDAKTRLQKTGTRQEVTGLTVNAVANVSRKYISDLRWILSVWEKDGYAKAYARFYPKYKHEKGYIKKGEPVMENVIGGKLEYLRMVRGTNNPAYVRLQARYNSLQQLVFVDNETDKSKSYVYVQPYSLTEFQELFNTKISLSVSREKKLVGKCEIDGREKTLAISKSTQEVLCPDLGKRSAGDSVISKDLDNCYVTLCQRRGKNFWLITKSEPKRSHSLSIQNLNIDPGELLDLWEQKGLNYTVDELARFVQFAKPGDSILNWDPMSDTDPTVDRGIFAVNKNDIITFFLKNKNVTTAHRKKAMQLMLAEISNKDASQDIYTSQKIKKLHHSPKRMIEFLRLFSINDYFKWYTHRWDQDGLTLEHLVKTQDDNKQLLNDYAYKSIEPVNERTYHQVWNFINFNNSGKNTYPWDDNEGGAILTGWHSVLKECRDKHINSIESIKFSDGSLFLDYIRKFKASIEFRTDLRMDDRFNKVIRNSMKRYINGAVQVEYLPSLRKIGYDINIYCDVPGIIYALKIICDWIVKHKVNGSKVIVDLQSNHDSYELAITHCGSYFANVRKLENPSGDFAKLRTRLFSVCDFMMRGDLKEGGDNKGSITIYALDSDTTKIDNNLSDCRIDNIDNPIDGVTYILKFYK